jgi:hypothetical protein
MNRITKILISALVLVA